MGGKRHILARLNLLNNAHHRAANATENQVEAEHVKVSVVEI